MTRSRIAVFPGSFDPMHNGHLDLLRRAAPLFDEIVVAVLDNQNKAVVFSLQERMAMVEELFENSDAPIDGAKIRVASFDGLVAEFARSQSARFLLRGLRTGADFEYELPMTVMNRRLNRDLETVFLPTQPELADLSSRLIKEVLRLGGDPGDVLPAAVRTKLIQRLQEESA